MEKKIAQKIVEAAEVIGLELQHDETYSGRGMYGNKTDAIIAESLGDLLQCVAYAAGTLEDRDDLDEFVGELSSICTDNMGRSAIVYY